jgi:hypothetical protein
MQGFHKNWEQFEKKFTTFFTMNLSYASESGRLYLHLLQVYYAYSFMTYGITFWGTSEAALRSVFVAQKRLVRALAGERYWPTKEPLCASRPLCELLNLLFYFLV